MPEPKWPVPPKVSQPSKETFPVSMTSENEKATPPGEKNLRDEEVIESILVSGTQEEREQLKTFHNLSSEKLDILEEFARLRHQTLVEMRESFKERIMNNPEPTEEEWRLGVYREEIEPQVYEAISLMRRKGFNTYESGFSGPEKQRIGFDEVSFESFRVPAEVTTLAREKGLKIEVSPNAIELKCSRYVDLSGLAAVWRAIAESLPTVGSPAGRASTGAAMSFQKRVENIKANPQPFIED